jgi:signal transduction histidine kinase/CheY-like chemotaxis protein
MSRLISIRAQLVGLVAAIVLPLVAASAWMAWQQYETHREALGQSLLGVARALSAAADRELATGLTLVQAIGNSPLIDEKRFQDFYNLSAKALASRPGAWMVLFEPSGQMVLNTLRPYGSAMPNVFEQDARLPPPRADEVPRGGAGAVRKAFETQRPVYSDLFEGQVSGSYLVAVSAPVMREGRMVYCLTIAIPASTFQPLVSGQARLRGSGAALFDSRGFIIARATNPEASVGKRVPADSRDVIRDSMESIYRGTNPEGQAFFAGVARSQISGWGAGVALDEDAAFGAIWRSMRASAVAAALILVTGIAAALWMGRTLARRREAEAESRAKDQFLAALSHELRNPIAAIALAAELLKRIVQGDRRAGEVIETVSRQVTQLGRLLDDLLDNTRAMYGKLTLAPRHVDLRACVDQIAQDYSRRANSGVRIDAGGGPAWVNADPARLHQMIDNLVENAVKYGARTISVNVGVEGATAVVTVSDDGQGIPAELLPRLFEPFVQGEQSMERAQGGLGLGLALVRRLAVLHGGSVSAQSAGPGKGSRFTLRMPLASPEPKTAASDPPQQKSGRPRRVLIVEDVEDSRESLRLLLEMDGHEVALAADGTEGLAKLRSFRPDVAVIDIGLPGMNGYELAREARAQAHSAVILIALTGYGQANDRRQALEAGFDVHLTKPVSLPKLQEALNYR